MGGVRVRQRLLQHHRRTSPSHARRGVRFAAVSALDSAASVGYGAPASRAVRRMAMASLNTTLAHPNARASAIR